MIPRALLAAHVRDLAELERLAMIDLAVVFTSDSGPVVRDRLIKVLPDLADAYGSAASSLAADWYDEARSAAGVPGRARAIAADLPDRGRTNALARWAVGPLFSSEPDVLASKALASGGFQRILYDADRNTILRSVAADERGVGYERGTVGRTCDFCMMLAGRGAVYRADTADFLSHDNCHCYAIPAYDIDLTDSTEVIDLAEVDLTSA